MEEKDPDVAKDSEIPGDNQEDQEESKDQTDLTDPTDPTDPMDPTVPTDPTDPTDPIDPIDPTDPKDNQDLEEHPEFNENTDPKKLVELLFGISQEDTEEFASKKGYDVDDEVIEVLNESVQENANTQGYISNRFTFVPAFESISICTTLEIANHRKY